MSGPQPQRHRNPTRDLGAPLEALRGINFPMINLLDNGPENLLYEARVFGYIPLVYQMPIYLVCVIGVYKVPDAFTVPDGG